MRSLSKTCDGIVLDINPAACRLHGMTREELIGQTFATSSRLTVREEVVRDFQALVEGRLQQIEGVSCTQDGRIVPVEVRASRVNYAGQPAVLLHVRDITDRKLAEAALRSSGSSRPVADTKTASSGAASFGLMRA